MNAARILRVFLTGMFLGATARAAEGVRWVEWNGDADCLELVNATPRVLLSPHRGGGVLGCRLASSIPVLP